MINELLLEGAVAGHMNHIYDNGEMTFGELKQLLQAVSDGKIRGTEKTDGQNIFLSFNVRTQKAKAIRNQGNIKAGGLDTQALDDFFSDHPSQALRFSFVEALQAFEEAVKQVDRDTQEKIFGRNNEVYFNTEVMNPGTPGLEDDDPRGKGTTNVIPYDKKTLLIHRVGHGAFDVDTGKKLEQDVTQNFDMLEQAITGMASEDPAIFSVETNQIRRLSPMKDKDILNTTISELDNLIRDQGLSDDATINDYVISQVKPEIDALGLTEDRNEMILKRVMGMPGKPNLRQITAGLPADIKSDISSFVKEFNYTSYTTYMQNLLHNFSVEAVNGLDSAFISDNEKQIKFLQDEIRGAIKRIEDSSNERAKTELVRQMEKLKAAEGINTPSEGFVFSWNDVTYKLTGNFAPANQILGMERFQRFGPIEPGDGTEDATESDSKPLKIALFPGSFKPPHKGHILAAEALAEDVDVVYIFVSAPELSGRALKNGNTISADQAIQCWNAMIDKSPLKNKARIMVGPKGVASPMMTAINFIQHPASADNIFAAPKNSTVVLGVGAKGSDADRYGPKIMQKSKENRPDLTIKKMAVGPFQHSQEYLDLLSKHPSIGTMLNKGRGRVSPDELSDEERLEGKVADKQLYHASDMRDFIDLATEDPIGLELLKDFVPLPEDVYAVMGILGLNPVDLDSPEENQVEEPIEDNDELTPQDDLETQESDKLSEILRQEVEIFFETFKVHHAPKPEPSSGKFQRNMKRKLSKAHKTYLDMGRHDLTRHGGGFHLSRPKDVSNAFLAEEDIEEASAAGAVAGYAGNAFNIKRNQKMTKQEKRLRMKIRKGLKAFFEQKRIEENKIISNILEEHKLRLNLRKIIFMEGVELNNVLLEQEDPNTDVHDSTGINTLKDLLKNTNVLATLRDVYKTLTTSDDQKKSFRAHVIKWTQDTLAPVKLNDTDAEDGAASALAEQADDIGIDILGINDEDRSKFIDASDGSEKDSKTQPEVDEEEPMQPISGEDTTGRNKAERIYPNIEKSIVDYFGELDHSEDQEMFYDYLIANMKLYFDKWDNESSKEIEEPTNDAYQQAQQSA